MFCLAQDPRINLAKIDIAGFQYIHESDFCLQCFVTQKVRVFEIALEWRLVPGNLLAVLCAFDLSRMSATTVEEGNSINSCRTLPLN